MDLRAPCPNCPFRTDVRPYLNPARAIEIVESITDRDQSFACHKHTMFGETPDGESVAINHRDDQHCAGAMILLERMDQPNQWMRIAERLGFYDRTRLKMDAPVYEDGDAMIAAYEIEDCR